jgi:nicotinate-nucleotide pyrophosphorylase (carboxylating)
MSDFNRHLISEIVRSSLKEDTYPLGDLTSTLIDPSSRSKMAFVAREKGIVAGCDVVIEAFAQVSDEINCEIKVCDGKEVLAKEHIIEVVGPTREILTAERTALNFLSHLSGVATVTNEFVKRAKKVCNSVEILDTRKTLPNLRILEKMAVRAGGGKNHRANLSDAILIKDNHLKFLSLAEAIKLAKTNWPGRMVEVECDTLEDVKLAVGCDPTVIMLDNMAISQAKSAIDFIKTAFENNNRRPLIEISGGINLSNIEDYARLAPDFISVGSITQSAKALDIGLDLVA